MHRDTHLLYGSTLCAALFFLGALTSRAGEVPPAEQETPEQQATRLQGGFVEATVTRDWKKLETVADGLKAAGLNGTELEVVLLRGERDAAFSGRCLPGQVLTWGLSCRAMAGDPKALTELREAAQAAPDPAAMPSQELWTKDRDAATAAMKEFHANVKALGLRDEAVMCLALLKEPDVLSRAMACLTGTPPTVGAWYGGGRGDVLITAVLLASPEEGWGRLSALLTREDDQIPLEVQARVLQGMMGLMPRSRHRYAGEGKEPTSVEAAVAAVLPKDAEEQLLKAYTAVLKRYPAEAPNQMLLRRLVMMAYSLPRQDAGSEVLTAIEGLRERIGPNNPEKVNLVRVIDGVLARHKATPPDPAPQAAPPTQKAPE